MSASRNQDDYFNTGDLLSEEALAVQDRVRHWVDSRVYSNVGRWWHLGRAPKALFTEMAQVGVFVVPWADHAVDRPISLDAYGLIMQELERADSGLRTTASVQSALVMYAIARYGTKAQQIEWLPRLQQGDLIGAFALSEAGAGSDPASLRCWCQRRGDDWVLHGNKRWVTHGGQADLLIVWARNVDAGQVEGFIVPRETLGLRSCRIETHGSMRLAEPWDLFLNHVRVPDFYRLVSAKGLGAALDCITRARYGVAWGVIGAAIDCYREAEAWVQDRLSFRRRLSETQLIQAQLVDMQSHIVAMQLRAVQLGRLDATGKLRYPQVALVKRDNARSALVVARTARAVMAAHGMESPSRTFRHMANLESVETYEGTYEVQTMIVGRDLTGRSAF